MTGKLKRAATEAVMAAEGRWMMGRHGPRELVDGIGAYLERMAPDRAEELVAAIRTRRTELAEAGRDMVVDGPSAGMLELSATVLAAYEVLLPIFADDRRRTVRYLQHVVGGLLRRPLEIGVEALAHQDDALAAVDRACRTFVGIYGDYFDIAFERPTEDALEMRVGRCFFRDFFARNQATPVTTVLCAWDRNWMVALDPAISGLRSERTTLMSLGDDACRFRVLRTDDPLATHRDALEEAERSADEPGRG
jgi:hypothetical protein